MATVHVRTIERSRTRAATASNAPRSEGQALESLTLQGAVLIVVFGAALLLLNLGGRALTYHEALFAQPAREMLGTGDYVLPRFVEVPYVDKPPATAWAIAASMALFGAENEWTARLPSVAAELWIALVVAFVAARWFDQRTGLVAGCLQITSVYTLMQARLAESDMMLAAAVTTAWGALALGVVPRPSVLVSAARRGALSELPTGLDHGVLAVVFYLAAGASFLIKGPIGPALIFGGALGYAAIARNRATWQWFMSPVGIGLLVASVSLWPLAAYVSHPQILDAWRAHHWGRFRGDLGGYEPPGFYLYTGLWLMLPWTPALIWGAYRAMRNGQWRDPAWLCLLAWTAPGLVVLSLSRFQHKHYLIPLLPPLAVASAVGLIDFVRARNLRPVPPPGVAALLVLAGVAAAIAAVVRFDPPATSAIVAVLVLVGLGQLWIAYCEARREPRAALVSMLGLAWLGSAAALVLVMPAYDSYDSARELAAEIDRHAPRSGPTFLVGLAEYPGAFYVTEPLARIDDPRAFLGVARRLPPVTHVVAPARCEAELAQLGSVRKLASQESLQSYLSEADRPTLFRLTQASAKQ